MNDEGVGRMRDKCSRHLSSITHRSIFTLRQRRGAALLAGVAAPPAGLAARNWRAANSAANRSLRRIRSAVNSRARANSLLTSARCFSIAARSFSTPARSLVSFVRSFSRNAWIFLAASSASVRRTMSLFRCVRFGQHARCGDEPSRRTRPRNPAAGARRFSWSPC